MTIQNYKIVEENELQLLAIAVNDHIANGYVPVGAITAYKNTYGNSMHFAQAMVLRVLYEPKAVTATVC